MLDQGEEKQRVSTTRVCRPAEEETRCFDEGLGEQTEPQQGLVNNPG